MSFVSVVAGLAGLTAVTTNPTPGVITYVKLPSAVEPLTEIRCNSSRVVAVTDGIAIVTVPAVSVAVVNVLVPSEINPATVSAPPHEIAPDDVSVVTVFPRGEAQAPHLGGFPIS